MKATFSLQKRKQERRFFLLNKSEIFSVIKKCNFSYLPTDAESTSEFQQLISSFFGFF